MIDLKEKAKELRREMIKAVCRAGGGHMPATLSIIDIVTVLYYGILNVDPDKPDDPHRDRFILSKGHACVALYAALADKGFFDRHHLGTFGKCGTILGGHPDMHKIPGVEASTGALGHGFPFGVGIALSGKLDNAHYRVITLLGDGECQEGSIWEAAMFASHHKLDNMTAIVDFNKQQAMDYLDKIIGIEPFAEKWRAFGWEVKEVDGHDFDRLHDSFNSCPFVKGKPSLIIAHTTKGKGVSFMEHDPLWHYRMPNLEEMKIVCKDLNLGDFWREFE